MPVFSTAGSTLYIGGPLNAPNKGDMAVADFAGQTALWKEIIPIENLGRAGDVSEEIMFTAINGNNPGEQPRVRKMKGAKNAGNMEVIIGIDYEDEGQIALLAAEKSSRSFAFKMVFNDAPATGTAPAPSQRLFVAYVMSAAEQLDEANNVMKLNASLSIDSNIVRVNATTGD